MTNRVKTFSRKLFFLSHTARIGRLGQIQSHVPEHLQDLLRQIHTDEVQKHRYCPKLIFSLKNLF